MSAPLSPRPASPEYQEDRDGTLFPPSLDKIQELVEDKELILHNFLTEDQESSDLEGHDPGGGVCPYAVHSQELTSHLSQLQRQTEQELTTIHIQLCVIRGRLLQLNSELCDLEQSRGDTEDAVQRDPSLQHCTWVLRARQDLERSFAGRSALSERLVFQEQALSSLCSLLNQDLRRYREEAQRLHRFTQEPLGEDDHRPEQESHRHFTHSQLTMLGKNETEQSNNMETAHTQTGPTKKRYGVNGHADNTMSLFSTRSLSGPESSLLRMTEVKEQARRTASRKTAAALVRSSNALTRSRSVKDLIGKFSDPDSVPGSPRSPSSVTSSPIGSLDSPIPSIRVIPPFREAEPALRRSDADETQGSAGDGPEKQDMDSHQRGSGDGPKTQDMDSHQRGSGDGPETQDMDSHQGSSGDGPEKQDMDSHQRGSGDGPEKQDMDSHQRGSGDGPEKQDMDSHQRGSGDGPEKQDMDSHQGSSGDGPEKQDMDSHQGSSTPNGDDSLKKHNPDSGRDSLADSGMGSESDFDPTKPSEEEPSTPKVLSINHSQNPKYQLFLSNDLGNGLSSRDPDGPAGIGENGPRASRWESSRVGLNHYKGSLESLASRDWDTMSERAGGTDSPPRAFHSPYTTVSMDYNYNPAYRMSDYKVQGRVSPATSELNLLNYSRSTSPVPPSSLISSSNLGPARGRFSTFDTLRRNNTVNHVIPNHLNHMPIRSATLPHKRDYIEELTKQLDTCQKRNQFLEAESVEMDKERNQIRFEMRGLLVNNEDLLRTNAQLTNEMKRMSDRMMEMEKESQVIGERWRSMEVELKEARDMMVEANTQEYAFNFLQQSLKNKIKDAEENLEKQTLHAQGLAEKLWLAERQLEELEATRENRDKRSSDLGSTVFRLENELAEALQMSTQAGAELSLQQKLYQEVQAREEELQESLLEKSQELQKAQDTVSRLQGEVFEKLLDKERTLEEEIQLKEKIQLQWKQSERTVDDLDMELQTSNQARDDLAKQVKQFQEKLIDLESDVEELHESEQRWASKHKRALEQSEQVQMKLIQEKDISDQLECEKAIMEKQLRELRVEVEELQNAKVSEDVISKSESRAKELENALRTEERNKVVLTNTISKLERKINELSDQMEEEHKMATEQKDLMTQRIRSLKRQLSEAEEETSRREAQYRHTQRELTEERETSSRLQRQLLDQHLQIKRKEASLMRQTLDSLRLDLSVDEDEEQLGGQSTNA